MSEIVFVPGLGDGAWLTAQHACISALNLFRSETDKIDIFDSRWGTEESPKDKRDRLMTLHPRIAVAISGGGPLAVPLVKNPELERLHIICGKIARPETIGPEFTARAPALVETVEYADRLIRGGIDTSKLTCYVPKGPYDGVIETQDMHVAGSEIIQLPEWNHVAAIGYALARYLPRIR